MKVLIVGAAGYIGGSVASKLLAQGHMVSGLTRSPDTALKLKALGITPIIGSNTDVSRSAFNHLQHTVQDTGDGAHRPVFTFGETAEAVKMPEEFVRTINQVNDHCTRVLEAPAACVISVR